MLKIKSFLKTVELVDYIKKNLLKRRFFLHNFYIFFLSLITILLFQNFNFQNVPVENGYDVIVVAGQSNALGTGYGNYYVDKSLDSRIFQLGRYGTYNKQIILANDILQGWYYDPAWTNIGFGMSFARQYVKTLPSSRKVLLVPVARGATSILQWQQGSELYNDMINRTRIALAQPNSRLVALLWHQGESDVDKINSKSDPLMLSEADYHNQLKSMLSQFRKEFVSQSNFPIIMGKLVPSWSSGSSGKKQVESATLKVAYDLNRALVVNTDGLKSNFEDHGKEPNGLEDKIHFSASSQVELGMRYFQDYVSAIQLKFTPTEWRRKSFVGYQAWFETPINGVGKYTHWSTSNLVTPNNVTVEMWPNVSEYQSSALVDTGLKLGDGSAAKLYHGAKPEVIDLHFKWMSQYEIDGAFLQWFLTDSFTKRLDIVKKVKSSAEKYNRSFSIMFDISGASSSSACKLNGVFNINTCLRQYWMSVVDNQITASNSYMKINGLPVISLWGIGFVHNSAVTAQQILDFISWVKSSTKYKAVILGGVPASWRTRNSDALPGLEWEQVYNSLDIISPWTVGRYSDELSIKTFMTNTVALDLQQISQKKNQFYLPVLFPGFSWSNLVKVRQSQGVTLTGGAPNLIPRKKGEFMWAQAREYFKLGLGATYTAMFDEVDEGTAIYKTASTALNAPADFFTLTLNKDGDTLPSDWYLKVNQEISKSLKSVDFTNRIPISLVEMRYKAGRLTLSEGKFITVGTKKIAYQSDGNFVVYTSNWVPLWASNTSTIDCAGKCRMVFQIDGSLTLMKGEAVYWSTNSKGLENELVLTDAAPYVRIEDPSFAVKWTTSIGGQIQSKKRFQDWYVSQAYQLIYGAVINENQLALWNTYDFNSCEPMIRKMIVQNPSFYINRDNSSFVKYIYSVILMRDVDPSGLSTYVNFLNNGGTRSSAVDILITSQEFSSSCQNSWLLK